MILFYFLIAFLGGASIVISRILNSKLGQNIGSLPGVFYNFSSGLIFSILLLLIFDFAQIQNIGNVGFGNIPYYYYLGGLFGLAITFLSNVFVPKLSAFYFSLFMFTGQLISSMVFDYILNNDFSVGKLLGCILVVIGLTLNLLADKEK